MRTRAYRRHQRARTKVRHVRDYYELSQSSYRLTALPPRKDIAVRHPRDCGRRCYLCGTDPWTYRRDKKRDRREAFVREWVAAEGWGLDSDA